MRSIAAVLLFSATTLSAAATNWPEDVRVFARELPRRHASAFHRTSADDFHKSIEALQAKAAGANDSVMFVELSRITAAVGDAHTYVQIPATARRLPIGFGFFDGEWRVTHTVEAHRDALGAKLVRVSETPVDDAVQLLSPLLPQGETDAYVRGQVPGWLSFADALHGLGIAPSRDRVTYTLARDGGGTFAVDVDSVPWSPAPAWIYATKELPLARQKPSESFWYSWIEPQKTVYVAFRRYDDLRGKARELWKFVDANPVEKIVIDLRTNGGGDYTKGRAFIVDELKRRPKLRAFALVGPRTISAAMTNAVDLRNAGATLVGTAIGERPNSYQEGDQFTLPSSKLVVSYSTRLYKFVPDDAPNVIEPDQRVDTTWDDHRSGRDPALQWILEH